MERLLRTVAPGADDVFLEIGPGRGALTLPLAARCRRVVAIEIDGALAARLRERAPANLEVVEGDALTYDLKTLVPPGSRVAGNLPYYVGSPLLRRILDLRGRVRDGHLMLQEEVARRVAAAPGSRDYGILSVLFALWADVRDPVALPAGLVRSSPEGLLGPPPCAFPAASDGRDRGSPGLRAVGPAGLFPPEKDA